MLVVLVGCGVCWRLLLMAGVGWNLGLLGWFVLWLIWVDVICFDVPIWCDVVLFWLIWVCLLAVVFLL